MDITLSPEFYQLLAVCQEVLGLDSRNAQSQADETRLDWLTVLRKGEKTIKRGKARVGAVENRVFQECREEADWNE